MAGHYFSETPPLKPAPRVKLNFTFQGKFFTFWTSPGIFSSSQVDAGTRIFLEYADLPLTGRVLDLGAGYGVIGIVVLCLSGGNNMEMTFIENNPTAGALIRKNLGENKCPKSNVIVGDFLEHPFSEYFDHIVCNPPLKRGLKYVEEMFAKAASILTPEGTFQFVAKTHLGAKRLRDFLTSPVLAFLHVEEKKIKSGYRVIKGVLSP